jgi:hypothetical protein
VVTSFPLKPRQKCFKWKFSFSKRNTQFQTLLPFVDPQSTTVSQLDLSFTASFTEVPTLEDLRHSYPTQLSAIISSPYSDLHLNFSLPPTFTVHKGLSKSLLLRRSDMTQCVTQPRTLFMHFIVLGQLSPSLNQINSCHQPSRHSLYWRDSHEACI